LDLGRDYPRICVGSTDTRFRGRYRLSRRCPSGADALRFGSSLIGGLLELRDLGIRNARFGDGALRAQFQRLGRRLDRSARTDQQGSGKGRTKRT
jgi:hypothetical protein